MKARSKILQICSGEKKLVLIDCFGHRNLSMKMNLNTCNIITECLLKMIEVSCTEATELLEAIFEE